MQTTPEEKKQLRTIIQKLLNGDDDWLQQEKIVVSDKQDYWILNYDPGHKTQYNRLVRGMVVGKSADGAGDCLELVASFPFMRFFNRTEEGAAEVDVSNADMIEKLDGVMVGVFFPFADHGKPGWHTRKMLSLHEPDLTTKVRGSMGRQYALLPLVGEHIWELSFSESDVAMTYVFEFVHDATFVWTKYTSQQQGLYLIGARNTRTHKELSESQLNHAAETIGARRPRRWDAVESAEEIGSMIEQAARLTPNFEGFVFRDRLTGHRVKVKDPEYVKHHHMLGEISYRSLVPRVLEGEGDEVGAYIPLAIERIEQIKSRYETYLRTLLEKIAGWRDLGLDRKSLAMKLFNDGEESDRFARSQIMRFFEEPDDELIRRGIDRALRQIGLGGPSGEDSSPKRLLEILRLADEQ